MEQQPDDFDPSPSTPVSQTDLGESYKLTDEQRREAKKRLARQRRRLRGGVKRKVKKAAKFSRYRLEKMVINPGWCDNRFANIAQIRTTPEDTVLLAVMFVDLGCRGPKHGRLQTGLDLKNARRIAKKSMEADPVDCSPHLAAKIVEEAALMGVHLDFSIPPECFPVMTLLDRFDPDRADEDVPLGAQGKPFYIAGPHDDVDGILEHLEQRLGADGFHYMVPGR